MQIKVLLLGAAIATGGVGPASGLEDSPPRKSVPAHLESDKEIQTAIVKGIVANPNVFAASLRVEVADGMVTLRGRVRNREAKAAAGKIARSAPGVRRVENLLKIAPKRTR
jgi:osmotically-inducible protein OsmY